MIISESDLLRQALTITTEIERINESLHRLLTTTSSQDYAQVSHVNKELISKKSVPAVKSNKPVKAAKINSSVSKKLSKKPLIKSSKVNKKTRPISSSGPLREAVLKVLEEKGAPMKVKEIFDVLEKKDYQWTTDKPLRQLYVRIAQLPGAVRVGDGEYALKNSPKASSKGTPKSKEIPTSSEVSKEEVVSNSNFGSQDSSPSLEKPVASVPSDIKTENTVATPTEDSAKMTNGSLN